MNPQVPTPTSRTASRFNLGWSRLTTSFLWCSTVTGLIILLLGSVTQQAQAQIGTPQCQDPTGPALDFQVFSKENVQFTNSESEGAVAVGGNLILNNTNYLINKNGVTLGGSLLGLYVAGQVVFGSGQGIGLTTSGVNPLGVKICNVSNATIHTVDQNNASVNTQITSSTGVYNSTPNIQLAFKQPANTVQACNLIDFNQAFANMQATSTQLSSYSNSVQLYTDPGGTTPATVPYPSNLYYKLTANAVNVLNIGGTNFNQVANFQPVNGTPLPGTQGATLIININAPGAFSWKAPIFTSLGLTNAQSVLINFYNTTALTLAANSSTIEGTIYAPFATITANTTANIEGQIIGQSYIKNGSYEDHYAVFNSNVCLGATCAVGTPVVTVGPCLTATNTYSTTATVTVINPAGGGTLTISNGVTSQPFTTTAGSSNTFTMIFNGLVSNGATGTITATLPGCGSATATYTAPISCTPTLVCQVQTPTVTVGPCLTATNTYSTTAVVTVQNPVGGATLTISNGITSQPFTTTAGSSNTFTMVFSGLTSDGSTNNITVSQPGCGSATATYTAPASCSAAPPVCSVGTPVVTVGACKSVTNAYSTTAVVTLTNTTAGILTVGISNGVSSLTTAVAGGLSSFTYTAVFNGLTSDGLTRTVTATLPGCGSATAQYTAPVSCSVAPVCSVGTPVVTAGVCNSATNTFSSSVTVTVNNPVAGQTLTVNDGTSTLTFSTSAGTSNTFTATFNNLPSDNTTRTITVSLPGCGSATTTYTAPASCVVAPVCSISATASAGLCQTATNTFSSSVQVIVTNPTGGQVLSVTDGGQTQSFTTTTGSQNTFTAIFNGLLSDGSAHSVTISLPGCGATTATYTAPVSCSIAPVCQVGTPVVTVGVCNSATNTFSVTAVVTLANTTAGVLTVGISNGVSSLTTALAGGLSSFTYTAVFNGLASDGLTRTVTVSLPGCGSATAQYTAPISCTPTLVCQVQTPTITVGPCLTATNTYSSTAVVTVQNPAGGQTLTISNGITSQPFTTTAGSSNTFTMVFNGLVSDGTTGSITATLPSCGSATAQYTAPVSCSIAPVCSISALVTAGICSTLTNTFSTTATVTVLNPGVGTLTVLDGAITRTFATTAGASNTFTIINTGIDSDGSVHTVTASVPGCSSATTTYTAPVSCTVVPVCSVSATATTSICDPVTNTYSTTAVVTVQNPVGGQTLTISNGAISQPFTTTAGSSNTFTAIFAGLISDGTNHTLTASLPGCGTATALYTAPVSCSTVRVCSVGTPVITPGVCNSATNTYSVTAVVTLTNTVAGVLTVTNGGQSLTTTVAGGLSTFTYSAVFNGQVSDGLPQTVLAILPGCGSSTATYTAPISCTPVVVCQIQTPTVTAGVCNSATNTYSATAVVTVQNPVGGQTLTISNGITTQPFTTTAGTGNTFTMVFNGLVSDGASHTITATLPGCSSATAQYTAPVSCSIAPVCSINPVVTPGLCASTTNTYSATAVVQLSNPPAGVLTVTNGASSLTTTIAGGLSSFTFTATFNGLISDGLTHTVTASLPGCSPATTTYTAPVSCSVVPVCSLVPVVTVGVCSTATNTYSTTATVTLTNPTGGVLTVLNGPASLTFSVPTLVGTATVSAIFNGLISDGATHTITATLPGCGSATTTYTAPISCTPVVACQVQTPTVTPGVCNSATNTYSVTAVVTVQNPVGGATLTISNGITSQPFTTTAGSSNTFTMVFNGLTSDGLTHTVTAMLPGCGTATAQYTAPASCSVAAPTAGLGDYVFRDNNKNGIQNAGDTPIAGVLVTLYTNGVVSATTVTNASGLYSFTGLTPGSSLSYSVGFTTPAGLTATSLQTGGNDVTDSDANPATGRTRSVTLAAGEFNANLDAGFVSPTSVTPSLTLQKVVDKSVAFQGDTLTYTLILTNTGSTSATNVVVRDSTNGLTYVPGTVSAPAGTSYVQGLPVSLWTVSAISAGQSLSLTYKAIVDSTGVIYNTGTIPGIELPADTAKVCTSVPIQVCTGSNYAFVLSAPAGYANYQFYNGSTLVYQGPLNSYTATTPGSYSIAVVGQSGCPGGGACCPVIIQEVAPPSFTLTATDPTCVSGQLQTNGQLTVSGLAGKPTTYRYQYSVGATFNAATATAAVPMPAGGVLVSNLSSSQTYTVRVYNSLGCYTDQTVTITAPVCVCPPAKCAPIVITRTRTHR